jgi:hypothetical protein
VIEPTTQWPVATFSAASQTGTAFSIGGQRSGLIEVKGTALTTATWSIQGSMDSGTTWVSLPTAALPTTSVPITTTATSQTTTSSGTFYVVSVSQFTMLRFITTSGTFTATSITITINTSSQANFL